MPVIERDGRTIMQYDTHDGVFRVEISATNPHIHISSIKELARLLKVASEGVIEIGKKMTQPNPKAEADYLQNLFDRSPSGD